ncbi:MAG: hypothetical protein ACLQVK_13860 [Acidimicrobiales bacterium]|jgi:hypothetical protein
MATHSSKTPGGVYSCGLYLPGHDVHWIQGLHAVGDAVDPAQQGTLVDLHADGALAIEVAGDRRRLWNHDPERLERLVERNRGEIWHQHAWRLLWTRSRDGRYAFCVADADDPERRPCPQSPPTGDLVHLLREAGGFSVSASPFEGRLVEDIRRAESVSTPG